MVVIAANFLFNIVSDCEYQTSQQILIEKAAEAKNIAMLQKLKVMLCMECGCCSYVCPAKRNLTFTNKMAKNMVRAATAKK